jgi:hypothetical protein
MRGALREEGSPHLAAISTAGVPPSLLAHPIWYSLAACLHMAATWGLRKASSCELPLLPWPLLLLLRRAGSKEMKAR